MRSVQFLGVVISGLALTAGCEREESATTPPAGVTPATPQPAPPTTMTSTTVPTGSADRMASDARSTLDRAAAGAQDAAARERDAASAAGTAAQTQAAATAQMTSDEAKKMLDQAMSYIKENKYDLAEKTLNQVEANKAVLPKMLQDQVATVRTALTTAKAGGGLQIPGFGAGGTK